MPDKSALVYGGRSPIALELCQQLALNGYTVHLVSRTIDETINKLAKDNGFLIVHKCDLEDSTESVKFALRLDDEVKGLRAVAFVHRYRGDASNSLKQFSVEVDTPYQILKGLAARTRTDECSVLITTSPAAHSVVGAHHPSNGNRWGQSLPSGPPGCAAVHGRVGQPPWLGSRAQLCRWRHVAPHRQPRR